MRFIKLALISFVLFFLLLTIISFLIPSNIRISKATNVNATPQKALQFIKDTATWKNWHPLYQQMLAQQKANNFKIRRTTDSDSAIVFQTQYATQPPIQNGFQVYQFPGNETLTIQWYMDFKLPWYPWQKFGSLFYENTYGQLMIQGLNNLKASIEE